MIILNYSWKGCQTQTVSKEEYFSQFSCLVVSNSFWLHGLQHARLPCPSPIPRASSDSFPSNQWCYPTISSSVIPPCLQSCPASGSFPVNKFFTSGGQVWECHLQHQFFQWNSRLISFKTDWLDLLAIQGTLKSLLQCHYSKHRFFSTQISLWSNSHIHSWPLEKTIALTRWTFVSKVMSLLFNMLSRLVIAFLPRSSVF